MKTRVVFTFNGVEYNGNIIDVMVQEDTGVWFYIKNLEGSHFCIHSGNVAVTDIDFRGLFETAKDSLRKEIYLAIHALAIEMNSKSV